VRWLADVQQRMDAAALPFLVLGAAGTVSTGADPAEEPDAQKWQTEISYLVAGA
jgi:hypothetical protein